MFSCRQKLNKQIQKLETHLRSSRFDDERKKSHSFASTTTPSTFQYETPKPFGSQVEPFKFNDRVQQYYEPGGYAGWSTSSVSFAPSDSFGMSNPVDRGSYIPKFNEVNYIEGSVDRKWSDNNFPWTKKLEV